MSDVDVVASFVVMTGSTEEEAIEYLAMYDFDLETAVVAYQAEHANPSPPRVQEESPHYSSVDTGSPLSAPSPASHQVEGFNFPQAAQRPPTPPQSRALGNFATEALQRLYARPDYVEGSDRAVFETECRKAAAKHCWMVVSVVDNSFPCECFTRDVWASEAMRSLNSGSLMCYEINVTHSRGQVLAEKYHVNVQQLPCLFVVDPVTQFKVQDLPLVSSEVWRFDSALVVDAIMLFITQHDPPHDPFANAEGAGQEPDFGTDVTGGSASASGTAATAAVVVDVDGPDSEAEMVSPPTITRHVAGLGAVPAAASQPDVAESVHMVPQTPVTLDEFIVPDGSASDGGVVKLRCRLPRSSPTLQLRGDTPVPRLVEYLAYLVYAEDTARFTAPPGISISSGFPPKTVTVGSMEGVTLSTWTGVRSGDMLTVRVNA